MKKKKHQTRLQLVIKDNIKSFSHNSNPNLQQEEHNYCPASQEWQWRHVLLTK